MGGLRLAGRKLEGDVTTCGVCRDRLRAHSCNMFRGLRKFLLTNLILTLVSHKKRAGSSARLERSTDNRKVAGSNPARPTIVTPWGDNQFFRQLKLHRNVKILPTLNCFPSHGICWLIRLIWVFLFRQGMAKSCPLTGFLKKLKSSWKAEELSFWVMGFTMLLGTMELMLSLKIFRANWAAIAWVFCRREDAPMPSLWHCFVREGLEFDLNLARKNYHSNQESISAGSFSISGNCLWGFLIHVLTLSSFMSWIASSAINWPVWVRLKRNFAVSSTFAADCTMFYCFLAFAIFCCFEQAVSFQPRPPCLCVVDPLWVGFEPAHHVEETFSAFFLSFR